MEFHVTRGLRNTLIHYAEQELPDHILSVEETKDGDVVSHAVIGAQGLTFIYGVGGTGKTMVCVDMAVRIAAGGGRYGTGTLAGAPVFYFAAEQNPEWETRFQPLYDRVGDTENFNFIRLDSCELDGANAGVDFVELFKARFGEAIMRIPKVIFIDPLFRTTVDDQMNVAAMMRAVKNLDYIADKLAAAVIVVSHATLPRGAVQAKELKLFGAQVLNNAAVSCLDLVEANATETKGFHADEGDKFLRLAVTKSNIGVAVSLYLRWINGSVALEARGETPEGVLKKPCIRVEPVVDAPIFRTTGSKATTSKKAKDPKEEYNQMWELGAMLELAAAEVAEANGDAVKFSVIHSGWMEMITDLTRDGYFEEEPTVFKPPSTSKVRVRKLLHMLADAKVITRIPAKSKGAAERYRFPAGFDLSLTPEKAQQIVAAHF